MTRFFSMCVLLIGAGTLLLAADFWEKKEFSEWSEKEVLHMLDDSPWARKVTVMLPGRASFSRAGGDAGGGGGFEGGGGDGGFGGGGGRGGRGGGGGGEQPELARPSLSLTVQWMSALPIKQAMVRSMMKSEQRMDEQSQQFLNRVEAHYVVAIHGIPPRMAALSEGAERFVEETSLGFGKNREPLKPEKVEGRPEGDRVTLYFFFPRTNPITLDDKNVEFVFKAENLEFKRKFKLQDMVYQGNLEL